MGGCPDCDNCDQDCNSLTIPSGQDGKDGKRAYIAYANDDQGNGFDLNDQTKDYVSIIVDDPGKTNDKSLHSGNWHFWGGSSGDHTRILHDDNSESKTTNGSFTSLRTIDAVPAGTLNTDGEALRVKAYFELENGRESAEVSITAYKNGGVSNPYSSKVTSFDLLTSEVEGMINLYIIRDQQSTPDSPPIETKYDAVNSEYQISHSLRFFESDTNNSWDWDNDDVLIEIKAKKTEGSGDIILHHTSVEIIEKS